MCFCHLCLAVVVFMWMNIFDGLWTTYTKQGQRYNLESDIFTSRVLLTEPWYQTGESRKGCAGSAQCQGGLWVSLLGKAQRDVWISEMLQTDEIPREPTMDNVIPPQWCRKQMERAAFKFLFHPCLLHIHEHTHTTVAHTQTFWETQCTHIYAHRTHLSKTWDIWLSEGKSIESIL